MNQLRELKNNEILKYYLEKPKFLLKEDEEKLINFLKKEKIKEFYDLGAKIIRSSSDVAHLYTYLMNKLESQGISNKEIKNHACWRLFNNSAIGWLGLHDPEIVEYCKNNSADKELLKEIKKVKNVKWFKEYITFATLEKQIKNSFEDLDNRVKEYFKFIQNLKLSKRITNKKYEELTGNLKSETSIFKGQQIIGSLISETLQEKLGFNVFA